jgi:predicted nicotinamide N-methyase
MIGGAQSGPPALEIIRTGTQLRSVPLVPQIRLHQASDPISLWQRTELAAGRTGLDPPFWAFAWAGGQALARYLLDHPEAVRGRQVIDIASGSGLVAIAAARAGAAAVTAYDIDPLAAAAIAMNAAANGVAVLAVCADVLDQDGLPSPGTDLVLAGDAFYERGLAARVMRFLERGHIRGTAVLAGDCGRAYLPRDRLTPLATYNVPGLRLLEDTDIKRTTIWAPLPPGLTVNPGGGQGLRATPASVIALAPASTWLGSGRHSGQRTRPGSTNSRPSKNRLTWSR